MSDDPSQLKSALRLERRRNQLLRAALQRVSNTLDEWPHLVTGQDGREYDLAALYLVVRQALVAAGEA